MEVSPQLRRRYLINTGFQVRWSLLIALVGALISTIFSVFLWSSIDEQNRLIEESIFTDKQLYEAAEDTAILLLNMPETNQAESENIGVRFDKTAKRYEAARLQKLQLVQHNSNSKSNIIIAVLLITLGLFVIGIFLTHSVAGPMLVIKQQLELFREVGQVSPRKLRRGDEFKDVYDTLIEALGSLGATDEIGDDALADEAKAEAGSEEKATDA